MTARLADGVVDDALEEDDAVLEQQVAQGHLPLPGVVAVALEHRVGERVFERHGGGPRLRDPRPGRSAARSGRVAVGPADRAGRARAIGVATRHGMAGEPPARSGAAAGTPLGVRSGSRPSGRPARLGDPSAASASAAGVAVWSRVSTAVSLLERHFLVR